MFTNFIFLPQVSSTVKLSASIGLDYGEAGYDVRAEFMDNGISASTGATVENFALYLEAEICMQPGCSFQVRLNIFHNNYIVQIYRQFSIHSLDSLSLVVPSNKTLYH